ncbi:MAG: hypothetical protein ABI479_06685 [Gallionella sp.]
MSKTLLLQFVLAITVVLGDVPRSYAGSDRLIMSMSARRMDQENLVYVRFLGPDGAALESVVLQQMVIREQDCSSGRILELIKDYKIGYAPKNMLVGIYLYPHAWNDKTLCFSVRNLGKIEQSLNPTANNGRSFQLKVAP